MFVLPFSEDAVLILAVWSRFTVVTRYRLKNDRPHFILTPFQVNF